VVSMSYAREACALVSDCLHDHQEVLFNFLCIVRHRNNVERASLPISCRQFNKGMCGRPLAQHRMGIVPDYYAGSSAAACCKGHHWTGSDPSRSKAWFTRLKGFPQAK
jgi:hypothetical protein